MRILSTCSKQRYVSNTCGITSRDYVRIVHACQRSNTACKTKLQRLQEKPIILRHRSGNTFSSYLLFPVYHTEMKMCKCQRHSKRSTRHYDEITFKTG